MNHVVLFLVGLSAQVCCSIPILDSKPYKLVLKRAEIVEMNTSLIDCKLYLRKIDRYNFAATGYSAFTRDLPLSTKVTVQVFEFLSNEYRPVAIHFEKFLCSLMETEYKYMFYPDLQKLRGNLPKPSCPVLKGNYSYENYQPHAGNFPLALPFKNIMVEFKITDEDVTIICMRTYLELDRDVVIREQFSGTLQDK